MIVDKSRRSGLKFGMLLDLSLALLLGGPHGEARPVLTHLMLEGALWKKLHPFFLTDRLWVAYLLTCFDTREV